jgi:hypothetical protein
MKLDFWLTIAAIAYFGNLLGWMVYFIIKGLT